jgi:hypothetical protein
MESERASGLLFWRVFFTRTGPTQPVIGRAFARPVGSKTLQMVAMLTAELARIIIIAHPRGGFERETLDVSFLSGFD